MLNRLFDCAPAERLRRGLILAVVLGVVYVPAIVTFVMLVSGNA